MSLVKSYVVLIAAQIAGKPRRVGDVLALNERAAQYLLLSGHIGHVVSPPPFGWMPGEDQGANDTLYIKSADTAAGSDPATTVAARSLVGEPSAPVADLDPATTEAARSLVAEPLAPAADSDPATTVAARSVAREPSETEVSRPALEGQTKKKRKS